MTDHEGKPMTYWGGQPAGETPGATCPKCGPVCRSENHTGENALDESDFCGKPQSPLPPPPSQAEGLAEVETAPDACQACNGYGHHHRDDSLSADEVRRTAPNLICKVCHGSGKASAPAESATVDKLWSSLWAAHDSPEEGGGMWKMKAELGRILSELRPAADEVEAAKRILAGRGIAEDCFVLARSVLKRNGGAT